MVEIEYGVPQKNSKHLALGSLYVFLTHKEKKQLISLNPIY